MSAIPPDRQRRPAAVFNTSGGRVRPSRRPARPDAPRNRAPLVVAAVVAIGWAAFLSYLPVAAVLGLTQLAEPDGRVGAALRAGLAGWLLGHGVPLHTSAGPLGLFPLTLSLLAAWRLIRAGVHISRAIGAKHSGSLRQSLIVAATVGIGYGLLGGIAAILVSLDGVVRVPPIRAGVTLAVFGSVAALIGALRTTRAVDLLLDQIPPLLRDGLRVGATAAVLLLAAGAAAAGLAVAIGGGEASDMIGAYRTGVAGQAGLTLISLGYAPNAVVWAAAYLLGPGFSFGVGTAVRTSEVSLGTLPAVPLLAGLPSGPMDGVGAGLLAVPVLIGMIAGSLLTRRLLATASRRSSIGWGRPLIAAAIGGPVAGILLAAAAAVSGGPLGGGRLAQTGPDAGQTGVVTALVIAVGAMIGAAAICGLVCFPARRSTNRSVARGAVRGRAVEDERGAGINHNRTADDIWNATSAEDR